VKEPNVTIQKNQQILVTEFEWMGLALFVVLGQLALVTTLWMAVYLVSEKCVAS
jgi:hypothetical protein